MERMELMKSGQTLKTVVPSVAQDDKLSSHQHIMLPASDIPRGPLMGPLWLGAKDQAQMDVPTSPCYAANKTATLCRLPNRQPVQDRQDM